MKQVLGIVASHRKVGNSEVVVKAVAEQMGRDWRLSLVRLPRLRILACKGCYACLLPGGRCELDDDVDWIFERIEEADAVIFGSPNYALAPVGVVKMLADRALQAAAHYDRFREKRTVVALTLGRQEYRGYADTALASQVRVLGLKVVALDLFYGTHPGEAALADDFEEKTRRLAGALVGEDVPGGPGPGRCPRCFSDLFRLHPEGLECAVCKAVGSRAGDSLTFHDFHEEFTEQGRKEHMEWLLMKKREYPGMGKALRGIRERFRNGEWLSPFPSTPGAAGRCR